MQNILDFTSMSNILERSISGFSIRQMLYILLILAGMFILKRILLFLLGEYFRKLAKKTETDIDDLILEECTKPLIYFIYIIAFYMVINIISFSRVWDEFLMKIIKTLFSINIAILE